MENYRVTVKKFAHANMDSLPLRFGIHFKTDEILTLNVTKDMGRDPQHSDRFHVEATFMDPTNSTSQEMFGHFVLEQKPMDKFPALVTVWRNDRNTEWGLSTTMTNLRRDGFVTVEQLLEMHPLYIAGKIVDSTGLVKHLISSIASKDIARFEDVASRARADTAIAIKNLERAREDLEIERNKAERMKALASEAIEVVTKHEETIAMKQSEIDALRSKIKEDEAKYKIEISAAGKEGSVATLSSPDTLMEVRESQIIRGSHCTVLVMGDGRTLHMKTSTFDKDGAVTKKANGLIGCRVRTTCWDPIGAPGKWSRQGYFRNIYLVE
jgi:type II secretory pathway component PulJ